MRKMAGIVSVSIAEIKIKLATLSRLGNVKSLLV